MRLLLLLLLAARTRSACHGPPYDRPPLWTFPVEEGGKVDERGPLEFFTKDPAYGAEFWFHEALWQDRSWSTCEAADAQLYYLPAFHIRVSTNGETKWHHFVGLLKNMTDAGLPPNWALNRTVMFLTGDWGPCMMMDEFADAVWVTHFGLHSDIYDRPCHAAGKYVVAPGHQWQAHDLIAEAVAGANATRELLFTYYGEPHGNGAPARNATILHWAGKLDQGFSVGLYTPDGRSMSGDMRNSRFCGAPHGAGWGSRLSNAILRGCIPVIMQDNSTLPLEPWLDYSEFAVRVPLADIPRLDVILNAIPPERVQAMLARVLEVSHYFDWDWRAGGKAFEGTMHAVHAVMRGRGLLPAAVTPY